MLGMFLAHEQSSCLELDPRSLSEDMEACSSRDGHHHAQRPPHQHGSAALRHLRWISGPLVSTSCTRGNANKWYIPMIQKTFGHIRGQMMLRNHGSASFCKHQPLGFAFICRRKCLSGSSILFVAGLLTLQVMMNGVHRCKVAQGRLCNISNLQPYCGIRKICRNCEAIAVFLAGLKRTSFTGDAMNVTRLFEPNAPLQCIPPRPVNMPRSPSRLRALLLVPC